MSVVSTWGGSSSDSYLDVSEADTRIEKYFPDSSTWFDLEEPRKEAYLRKATMDVDAGIYLGIRYFEDQTLSFPRHYGGIPLDISESQEQLDVQLATAMQAMHLAMSGNKRDKHAINIDSGLVQISESMGPVREQYTYKHQGRPALVKQAANVLAKYTAGRKTWRA